MSHSYMISTIALLCVTNMALRGAPFMLPKRSLAHPLMQRLALFTPPAIMVCLVAYCAYEMMGPTTPANLCYLFASALVCFLHLAFKSPLLSIVLGTAGYMVLLHYLGAH